MPKIYIRGEQHPIIVAQADAERILSEKNDATFKEMIEIGDRRVQKGQIKEISFSDAGEKRGFDLNDPADKQEILDFEKMIDGLKESPSVQVGKSVEFYGNPTGVTPGFVTNELLGGVHWTVVQYALSQDIIRRKELPNYVSWVIVADNVNGRIDASRYEEFRSKLDALALLRGRREYMQKQEVESQNKMVEADISKTAESKAFPETGGADGLPI